MIDKALEVEILRLHCVENKPFSEWSEVFPHATCTVTLVDRLTHRAEIIEIQAESYRLKESKERREAKAKARKAKPPTSPKS